MEKTIFIYVLPIIIAVTGIYLSFATDIIKDSSANTDKPYSLARTQLMWWSLIIISCFSSYYGIHSNVKELDTNILILLGISLTTTTAAKLIDVNDASKGLRHQDQNKGKNFFFNIISDGDGLSVHRFQAFLFNLIFGVIFITYFIGKSEFYKFDAVALALMGISSAGYISLKVNENNK